MKYKTVKIGEDMFEYSVGDKITHIKLPSGQSIGAFNSDIGVEISYGKYRVTSKNVREFVVASVDYT